MSADLALCGARRHGWQEGPAIGRHRIPCILASGHELAEHRDALGQTWPICCDDCGSTTRLSANTTVTDDGVREGHLCAACLCATGAVPADLLGVDHMAWQAKVATIPMNTYWDPAQARAHCEAHYRSTCGDQPVLAWYEEEPDADAVQRLYATHEGVEVATVYAITPLPVLAAYDPDGDE